MDKPTHPLQSTLDRVRSASYTAIDLFDIAQMRKVDPLTKDGLRKLLGDARQTSLNRAIIAASVGTVEELFESASSEYARASLGDRAGETVNQFMAGKLQGTAPYKLVEAVRFVADTDISSHWSALQRCSTVKRRMYFRKKGSHPERLELIAGNSYHNEILTAGRLSNVIERFTKIRNSFAHQDSRSAIFTKSEIATLRALARRPECSWTASEIEVEFIENYSCACAIQLDPHCSPLDNPLINWTVHSVHAQNSIHLFVGLTVSVVSHFAELLQRDDEARFAKYAPLVFRIQEGEWSRYLTDTSVLNTPHVKIELEKYLPRSR